MKYHVFVDFDGTVTVEDVGYKFFKVFTHGRTEDVVQKYHRGEITAIECLQSECHIFNQNPAPADQVKEFIESQQLTAGFIEFVNFCRAGDIRLYVLSAGFDFYIDPILKKYGLDHLEVLSNRAIVKNRRIYPEFIYYEKSVCSVCANCKGARIKQLTGKGEVSVFVGDGHSDSHGAETASIVFAKGYLAQYLDQKGIKYFRYIDFYDVIDKFRKIFKRSQ